MLIIHLEIKNFIAVLKKICFLLLNLFSINLFSELWFGFKAVSKPFPEYVIAVYSPRHVHTQPHAVPCLPWVTGCMLSKHMARIFFSVYTNCCLYANLYLFFFRAHMVLFTDFGFNIIQPRPLGPSVLFQCPRDAMTALKAPDC